MRLHSQGPMQGQYFFLMTNYCNLCGHFLFKLLFLETQPLYFLGTIMLISKIGTLTQTRMGSKVGSQSLVTCQRGVNILSLWQNAVI